MRLALPLVSILDLRDVGMWLTSQRPSCQKELWSLVGQTGSVMSLSTSLLSWSQSLPGPVENYCLGILP